MIFFRGWIRCLLRASPSTRTAALVASGSRLAGGNPLLSALLPLLIFCPLPELDKEIGCRGLKERKLEYKRSWHITSVSQGVSQAV